MAEISSHQKRELVERVSRLSKQECIQLYRIFQSNGVKFTENNNGVFINLAAVSHFKLLSNPAVVTTVCCVAAVTAASMHLQL